MLPRNKRRRLLPRPQTTDGKNDKDPVEVSCRIKPLDNVEKEQCIIALDSRTIKLTPPATSFAFRNGNGKEQYYKFQHVFNSKASQKQLFDQVAKPLVADLLQGKNSLLFAYGVTGSGKTHTMQGTPADGGILRRTLDVVFNSIDKYKAHKCVFLPDHMNGFDVQTEADATKVHKAQVTVCKTPRTPKLRTVVTPAPETPQHIPDESRIDDLNEDNMYAVFVTYIEIYQNFIYDLLEESPNTGPSSRGFQAKVLREDASRNMYIHGCTEVEVTTPDEALEVLVKGQRRRKVAMTHLNIESSRSHSIFSIRVVQAPLDARGEEVIQDKSTMSVSQLLLVDLAGSERNSRTKAEGARVKEAGTINNSLMTLRACVEALRENQAGDECRMVPYRDCKLTHYLKNYFDGEGKIKMVVCVNPSASDYDENQTVMKFAELVSEVQIDRATPLPQRDLGLPPGRRQANKLFKEIYIKLQEENVKNLEVDVNMIYRLAPAWPPLNYNDNEWREFCDTLKTYLRMRIQYREKTCVNLPDKIERIRSRILEMEKENVFLKQENKSLTALYNNALVENRCMNDRLFTDEITIDNLQKQLINYNKLVEELNIVREERDLAKNHGQREKQRMKDALKNKLRDESERLRNEMMKCLHEREKNLKYRTYQAQVHALKEALNVDDVIPAFSSQSQEFDQDHGNAPLSTSTPKGISSTTSKQNPPPASEDSNHHGPTACDLRYHQSLVDNHSAWLNHCPKQLVPMGTALQPALKNLKPLTKLKSTHFKKDTITNYCLSTQAADGHGGMETKIYKGAVLPTAGGGSQIVLQNVEVHTQQDLLEAVANKKPSEETKRIPSEDTHECCTAGIQP
nr:kinesin-like protein KIF23 [Procambarus clarkii]